MLDDHSIKVGGGQHITTLDKYKIPMYIRGELPYIPFRPYTDKEWETLPHVILTSDKEWDPTFLFLIKMNYYNAKKTFQI